jgi:hypothetical protein
MIMTRSTVFLAPILAFACCGTSWAKGRFQDQLWPGEQLDQGEYLESLNGRWRAEMMPGGKFAIMGLTSRRQWVFGGWESPNPELFQQKITGSGLVKLHYRLQFKGEGTLQVCCRPEKGSGPDLDPPWESRQDGFRYLFLKDNGQLELIYPDQKWISSNRSPELRR